MNRVSLDIKYSGFSLFQNVFSCHQTGS
jgi:hypothetical protein